MQPQGKRTKSVFVLCTGRCGSTTFIKACEHINNYSAAHESRVSMYGDERLNYPEYHIEADNRLSWFLGRLDQKYRDDAVYVHLHRNPKKVAESYNRRWPYSGTIVRAFANGILMSKELSINPCVDYVRTALENITHFLKDKTQVFYVDIDSPEKTFIDFWNYIHAEGDLEVALSEFKKNYNPSIVVDSAEDTQADDSAGDVVASLERVIRLSYEERLKVFGMMRNKEILAEEKGLEIVALREQLRDKMLAVELTNRKFENAEVLLKNNELLLNQKSAELEKSENAIAHLNKVSTKTAADYENLRTSLNKRDAKTTADYENLRASMSFRLGHAIILHLRSPLGWLKLPWAVIRVLSNRRPKT